jgi:hypothetical protein
MSKLINFYELIPKEKKSKYINYCAAIQHPSMIAICGPTGTGKTNLLMNLIFTMKCFHKIYLFAKKIDEDLYKLLQKIFEAVGKQVGQQLIYASTDLTGCKSLMTTVDQSLQNLVIFDDMIYSKKKDMEKVEELFIMARKANCTCVFLSQSYFKIPTTIRQNIRYLFIRGITNKRNYNAILGDFNLKETADEIKELYRKATAKPLDFLMIDFQLDKFYKNIGEKIN